VFENLRGRASCARASTGACTSSTTCPRSIQAAQKHTIEVVVDRFRVRADLGQRLAESFETALRLAEGTARSSPDDGRAGEEHAVLGALRLPALRPQRCRLEPRLFSFNNPPGPARAATGSGCSSSSTWSASSQNPAPVARRGAIRGWDRRNVYYFHQLGSLAEHYASTRTRPSRSCPSNASALLYGSGEEAIRFRYVNDRGDVIQRTHHFEGIVPTSSAATARPIRRGARGAREVPRHARLPGLQGSRLNREARHVFVGDRSLPQLSALPVGEAQA
jgi:excinuclease ABC subunit A